MLNEINLARADLNLLTLFEVILSERHVGRAAARLNLTPSAVSHGLGRLRRQLNDPLFLRTPKGVVPTARAVALAEPVADLLARARNVLASAAPFDAATSTRRFIIGAPDGVSSVFLPPLLAALRDRAPGIDIGLRQLLPPQGGRSVERAWTPVFAELESGSMDIAVAPIDRAPTRFVARTIYDEDFVVVARARHPFVRRPTLQQFCQMQHLVVSMTADPFGFVDDALEKLGLARRVALTVPDFASGLASVAETDLIATMPRRFVAMHAARFAVVSREVPLRLRAFSITAAVPRAALMDAGLAWLFEVMCGAMQGGRSAQTKRRAEARIAS
jgi:DNA-binding transcriptional LysR family regulator